jgi:hypothetical protein
MKMNSGSTTVRPGIIRFVVCSIALLVTGSVFPAAFAESILVIRESDATSINITKGIGNEVQGELELIDLVISRDEDPWLSISQAVAHEQPAAIVLIKNRAVDAYRKYLSFHPARDSRQVPVLCLMASSDEAQIQSITNAGGILNNVPVVTSVASLRMLLNREFSNIGAVVAASRSAALQDEIGSCRRERLNVVEIPVADTQSLRACRQLKKHVSELIRLRKIDVLLITADSQTLTPQIVKSVWEPLSESFDIPIILSGSVPDDITSDFSTMCIVPDDYGYGMQAAGRLFELKDNGWQAAAGQFEPLISVHKVVNCYQLPRLGLSGDIDIRSVDQIACAAH